MKALTGSLRLAWRSLSVAARLGVMAALLAVWLVSSVLTAALPGAFLLASSLAGMMVDTAQTVKGRHTTQVKELDGKLKTKTVEADDLRKSNVRLKGELDDAKFVPYRGAKRPIKEAVSDTSQRIAKRTAKAASRNIATMPGESIPVYGIAVVVAATTWEIYDACAMMAEMHELDVAFNPENAISDREVCGMRVPTAAELWQQVKAAPGQVWDDMKGYEFQLPDLPFDDWMAASLNWFGDVGDWMAGK